MNSKDQDESNSNPKQNSPQLHLRPQIPGHIQKLIDNCINYLIILKQQSSSELSLPSKEDHYKQYRYTISRPLENNPTVKRFLEILASLRYKSWIRRLIFIYFNEAHPITHKNLTDNRQLMALLAFYRRNAAQVHRLERQELKKLVKQMEGDDQLTSINWGQVKEKMKLVDNKWIELEITFKWVFKQLRDFDFKSEINEVSLVKRVIWKQVQDVLEAFVVINSLSNDVILAIEAVK